VSRNQQVDRMRDAELAAAAAVADDYERGTRTADAHERHLRNASVSSGMHSLIALAQVCACVCVCVCVCV
jgi:hypothetical protein